MLTASRWVPLITRMKTGPSVPVWHSMTARFRRITAPSRFRIRTASGSVRVPLTHLTKMLQWMSVFLTCMASTLNISEQVSANAPKYDLPGEGKAMLYGANFNYASDSCVMTEIKKAPKGAFFMATNRLLLRIDIFQITLNQLPHSGFPAASA